MFLVKSTDIFLKQFLEYGGTFLYQKHVTEPAIQLKTSTIGDLFQSAGLNGCIGSSDGTHVGMCTVPTLGIIKP